MYPLGEKGPTVTVPDPAGPGGSKAQAPRATSTESDRGLTEVLYLTMIDWSTGSIQSLDTSRCQPEEQRSEYPRASLEYCFVPFTTVRSGRAAASEARSRNR
eukprot:358181-Hanusia_phi.AAC.1